MNQEETKEPTAAHGAEQVNHPDHYKHGSREVIDLMTDAFGREKTLAFCELNAFKYRMRAGYKGDVCQDMEKAKWYERRAETLRHAIEIDKI